MKKFKFLVVISLVLSLFVTACGKSDSGSASLTIGISQFAEHPALDGAREGFIDELKALGVNAEIDYKNAQGDIPNTVSIAQKFIKDDVDLIFTIATNSAQAAKQATKDIPILFSAVTDPVSTGILKSMDAPEGNITGTSDMSPIEKQLSIFKEIDPTIEKIGIIFSTGEANSEVQVNMAKEFAKDLGLEIVERGVTKITDIPQAADSIIKDVDAIYTITDNMVASAINVVAEKATKANMITIGAEEAHVTGGIMMTDGISYYELGRQTARMAKEILVDKKTIGDIPVEYSLNTTKVFNQNTIDQLNINLDEILKDKIGALIWMN